MNSKNPRGWDETATEMAVEAPEDGRVLFEVTVTKVVGVVHASGGNQTPREAAFRIIAHNGDGEYGFPDEQGDRVVVVVETQKTGQ